MTFWNIQSVYHGANLVSPFGMFEDSFTGKGYDVAGGGHYFTDCRETAMSYARKIKEGAEIATPYMYVADLTFEKPYIRMNRDNCSPIVLPIPDHKLKDILSASPHLHDRDNSPLIDFGHGELMDTYGVAACHSRRVAARKQAHLYMDEDGVNINALENDWFKGHPSLFRSLLQNATGYDGIIVHFADGDNTFVVWQAHQIEIKEIWNDRERIR